jgi:hypothetical protein
MVKAGEVAAAAVAAAAEAAEAADREGEGVATSCGQFLITILDYGT